MNAEQWLATFRSGARYRPPPEGLMPLSNPELAVLDRALKSEPGRVSEQVVRLLDDIGFRTDPLFRAGGSINRDDRIIETLVHSGLNGSELGREAALQALHTHPPPRSLQQQGKALSAHLKDFLQSRRF